MALPWQTPLNELIRKFRSLVLEGPISGGKHRFMKKGTRKVRVPNPHHQEQIGMPLLKEILRQASISEDEWLGA